MGEGEGTHKSEIPQEANKFKWQNEIVSNQNIIPQSVAMGRPL